MGTAKRRYAVAAGLVVLAVALGAVFGLVVSRALAGYDIEPVADPTRSTVTVGDRPLAIWASPSSNSVYCSTEEAGSGRDSFSATLGAVSITDGRRSWERVGVVSGAPGSRHTLTCTTASDLVIGTADNPRLTRYVVLGIAVAGIALVLVVAAGTLALVTALRRRPTA
ncbi:MULTISPECIES: hypothetical protein [Aeromicrobium]|uniref:hypothetical protein n=1 Tax=Aeromicrobium TaxID=2040 RepID=UPI0006F28B86|nr:MULTISPECIES: hypothetical protein [Aeromicrobium]KQX74961.1 hypothetical protein ASD10_07050 [Aeromicrobium sp. Root472D3]MCL8251167.1 hypothetical protein [Aeromicrobium fastidiosum]